MTSCLGVGWLSSDYITSRINLDPSVIQKRLGNGFYEQRLINEQVAQLTGRRFLGNFTSDDQQFRALMDAGVTFATAFNLRPGIALTAEQIARLTSDIVWLQQETVTLPGVDGKPGKRLLQTGPTTSMESGDVPELLANAKGLLRINTQQKGQAAIGDLALSAAPGGVGMAQGANCHVHVSATPPPLVSTPFFNAIDRSLRR